SGLIALAQELARGDFPDADPTRDDWLVLTAGEEPLAVGGKCKRIHRRAVPAQATQVLPRGNRVKEERARLVEGPAPAPQGEDTAIGREGDPGELLLTPVLLGEAEFADGFSRGGIQQANPLQGHRQEPPVRAEHRDPERPQVQPESTEVLARLDVPEPES